MGTSDSRLLKAYYRNPCIVFTWIENKQLKKIKKILLLKPACLQVTIHEASHLGRSTPLIFACMLATYSKAYVEMIYLMLRVDHETTLQAVNHAGMSALDVLFESMSVSAMRTTTMDTIVAVHSVIQFMLKLPLTEHDRRHLCTYLSILDQQSSNSQQISTCEVNAIDSPLRHQLMLLAMSSYDAATRALWFATCYSGRDREVIVSRLHYESMETGAFDPHQVWQGQVPLQIYMMQGFHATIAQDILTRYGEDCLYPNVLHDATGGGLLEEGSHERNREGVVVVVDQFRRQAETFAVTLVKTLHHCPVSSRWRKELTKVDAKGHTPLDYARHCRMAQVIQLLEEEVRGQSHSSSSLVVSAPQMSYAEKASVLRMDSDAATDPIELFALLDELCIDEDEWSNIVVEATRRVQKVKKEMRRKSTSVHCQEFRRHLLREPLHFMEMKVVLNDIACDLSYETSEYVCEELTRPTWSVQDRYNILSDMLSKQSKYSSSTYERLVYTIQCHGALKVSSAPKHGDRISHSQLAAGLPVYAAGELVFERTATTWKLIEINNASGHYRPSPHALPRVEACLRIILDDSVFPSTTPIQLVDRFALS